jgi:hypothetical protein
VKVERVSLRKILALAFEVMKDFQGQQRRACYLIHRHEHKVLCNFVLRLVRDNTYGHGPDKKGNWEYFIDRQLNLPMQFVMMVDYAPMVGAGCPCFPTRSSTRFGGFARCDLRNPTRRLMLSQLLLSS